MVSPCRRDKEIKAARREMQRARATGIAPENASLHLQLIGLSEDTKRLKQQSRLADKVALKRDELLPKYIPYVARYLAEGEMFANPVFAHVVVWLFDTEQFDQAIAWAQVCIEQGQPTPEGIKRDWPHFVADAVLAWCEAQAVRGNSIEPYCSAVFEKVSQSWRLNEKLMAKWYKFCGQQLLLDSRGRVMPSAIEGRDRLEKAAALLGQAQEYNRKCGVKTVLERIDMRLRALTDS